MLALLQQRRSVAITVIPRLGYAEPYPSVEQNASDAPPIAERFDALLRAMHEYLDT